MLGEGLLQVLVVLDELVIGLEHKLLDYLEGSEQRGGVLLREPPTPVRLLGLVTGSDLNVLIDAPAQAVLVGVDLVEVPTFLVLDNVFHTLT